MSKLSTFLLWLTLSLGILLHITPYIINNEPFSTDVWPLIRFSEKIIVNPNVKIWDDSEFDGYSNRWPGVILASALTSLLTGFNPRLTYSLSLLSISLLTSSLILYAFAKKVVKNDVLALAPLLTWFFYPSTAVFTSSLLKEVYAYPFIFTLLFIVVKDLRRYLPLAFVVIESMVLSHHLASIMASFILVSVFITYTALKYVGYYRSPYPVELRKCVTLGLITGGAFLTYYLIYGGKNMPKLEYSDIATFIFYACCVVIGLVTYLKFFKVGYVEGFIAVVTILLLLFPRTPLLIGLNLNYEELLPYVIPALTPYVFLIGRKHLPKDLIALVYAFTIPPTTFSLYVLLAKPEFSSIIHRFMNYYFLPAGVLLGILPNVRKRVLKIFVILTLLSLIISSSSFITLSACGEGPAFYWRYSEVEVKSLEEVSKLLLNDIVGGDAKVHYFYAGVVRVDVGSVLTYSYAGKPTPPNHPVIVLREYFSKGYVSSLSVYRVDSFLTSLSMFNRFFDSSEVIVVGG